MISFGGLESAPPSAPRITGARSAAASQPAPEQVLLSSIPSASAHAPHPSAAAARRARNPGAARGPFAKRKEMPADKTRPIETLAEMQLFADLSVVHKTNFLAMLQNWVSAENYRNISIPSEQKIYPKSVQHLRTYSRQIKHHAEVEALKAATQDAVLRQQQWQQQQAWTQQQQQQQQPWMHPSGYLSAAVSPGSAHLMQSTQELQGAAYGIPLQSLVGPSQQQPLQWQPQQPLQWQPQQPVVPGYNQPLVPGYYQPVALAGQAPVGLQPLQVLPRVFFLLI